MSPQSFPEPIKLQRLAYQNQCDHGKHSIPHKHLRHMSNGCQNVPTHTLYVPYNRVYVKYCGQNYVLLMMVIQVQELAVSCKLLLTWGQANSRCTEVKILCLNNNSWILKYSLDVRQSGFSWPISRIMPFHLLLALWHHSRTICLTLLKQCWPTLPWIPLPQLHHLERTDKIPSIPSNSHS